MALIKKSLFTTLLACFVLSMAASGQLLRVKRTLPEFRDISVWKGRAGLTLFSPDGKYLAVSGKTADIVIYDTATAALKSKLDGDGFVAFSFSPDGKFAVAQNRFDLSMQVFETESGRLIRQIRGLGQLSNLSKMLGGSGIINELNGIFPTPVLELGRVPITSDWKNVLVNKNDSEFSIVDFDTGRVKFDLKHENFNAGWETTKLVLAALGAAGGSPGGFMLLGSTSNAQFSRNGKYLLIANGNKKPTLWEVSSGKLISKFDAGSRVFYSKFSRDGTMVATSDYDGLTKVWKTETGELVATIGSKKDRGVIVGWNNAGDRVLVLPLRKGDLRSYDARSGALLYTFDKSMPTGGIFNLDNEIVVTVPRKNKSVLFQIWQVNSGRLLATVPRAKHQNGVVTVKWSPNGQLVATADGLKKEIKIWNLKGELVQTLSLSTPPMEFSSDGRFLATGGVVPAGKVDTGYLWTFEPEPDNERLGMLR